MAKEADDLLTWSSLLAVSSSSY